MISGILIVSNANWYPVQGVVKSMLPVCDEIIVNIDGASDTAQGTFNLLSLLDPKIYCFYSDWNWTARDKGQELARQTNLAIAHAEEDFILDLQADEILHEDEHSNLLQAVSFAPADLSGFRLTRLYFFHRPNILRTDWSMPLIRLFRKGSHEIAGDAMDARTLWGRVVDLPNVRLFHYSRVAPAREIRDRIVSLSRLFHDDATMQPPEEYDWSTKKWDSYSSENPPPEVDSEEVLVPFSGTHPKYIQEWLKQRGASSVR